jgi:hypothetical protein
LSKAAYQESSGDEGMVEEEEEQEEEEGVEYNGGQGLSDVIH